MNLVFRIARADDFRQIQTLISKSARVLQAQYYKVSEIETALELVSGIEELIYFGSFLVAMYKDQIIGCGGWMTDVADQQKAEIRGFFVDPDFSRRGIATQLLITCENECLLRDVTTLFGDNYPVRFDDNYLDRLTDTKDNGEFHFYRELTLAWKTYHSTSREFIYEQTSTRAKPRKCSGQSIHF